MGVERITLAIYGLACGGGGALTVERSLARTAGVLRAYVNPLTEIAYVEYDPAMTDPTIFRCRRERLPAISNNLKSPSTGLEAA